jgi:TonB family protein
MRGIWLMAMLVLAAGSARGQAALAQAANGGSATVKRPAAGSKTAAARKKSAPAPGTVEVYEPHKPVEEPRLLPPAEPLGFPKHCTHDWSGQSELSLLVDTQGRPRNVMFLKPSGTMADRFAIIVVGRDRFAPGTLHGKPVVVAESMDVDVDACIVRVRNAAGRMVSEWALKSSPKQKLKKPDKPPQVAELAPLRTPRAIVAKKVTRPDFFGNGESAPVLLYSDYANYTPSQRGAKIKGSCEVSLVVDANGLPEDLHVLKKLDPGLDRSALYAVENYRFFPAIKANEPVAAAVVVKVAFAPPY